MARISLHGAPVENGEGKVSQGRRKSKYLIAASPSHPQTKRIQGRFPVSLPAWSRPRCGREGLLQEFRHRGSFLDAQPRTTKQQRTDNHCGWQNHSEPVAALMRAGAAKRARQK